MRFLAMTILFILSCTVACSAKKEAPPEPGLLIGASCVKVEHTNVYGFIWLGIGPATVYDCAVYENMSCKYVQGDEGSLTEMTCSADPSVPVGVPAGCTLDPTPLSASVHYYLTTTEHLVSDRYNCGALGPMRCDYYVHAADMGCDNYNGSGADDCAQYRDNKLREEVVCFNVAREINLDYKAR